MTQYSMYSILDKKKRGSELTKSEVKFFIDGLMDGSVPDYQASALLMAIFLQGMNEEETAYLTDAMLYSGKVLKFEGENVVDKHSTGGIGDKTSFILAPIAAACGVSVPMIAGRGLGFTGGTVDKIESIKGFKTNLGLKEFEKRLKEKGIVLIGQTGEIAPADKKIYALRDVTATIDSIPLITASIMSKKLAEGANGIVMDIKIGSGAFMKTKTQAKKLAKSIISTAKRFDKKSVCLITDMNQPLGNAVGNSLEMIESIEVLRNKGPKDITDLSVALAAHMIHIGGVEKTYAKALKAAKTALKNGSALKEFENLIKDQGGDLSIFKDYKNFEMAEGITTFDAPKTGYIKSFKNSDIGFMCTELGGGRKVATDKVDVGVGFYFHKKIGDRVKSGEPIVTIYYRNKDEKKVQTIKDQMRDSVIKISALKVTKPDIILDILSN